MSRLGMSPPADSTLHTGTLALTRKQEVGPVGQASPVRVLSWEVTSRIYGSEELPNRIKPTVELM